MSLKNLADETLTALDEALPDHDISEEQKQAVLLKLLMKPSPHTVKRPKNVAVQNRTWPTRSGKKSDRPTMY
jgi:hypothetical protein